VSGGETLAAGAVAIGSGVEFEESGVARTPAQDFPNPQWASRVACHVAGATILLVALIGDLAHGWRATGDDAIIAQRSFSTFSAHPPLVGQFSQGSGGPGHTFYDPGPLLFWILAVPVRLDPVHGVLWGSVLLCLAAVALAVEAAWAFRGAVAAAVVVVFIAIVASTQSFVVVNPAWNPSVGVVWFIATIATAATVGSGKLQWWPALVIAASIAAQSNLEFAAMAVGLVLLGLGLGLIQRGRPWKGSWVAVGLGVGVVCWAAPLVQEVTGQPGNLTVAWNWLSQQSTLGTKFGFQSLASVTDLQPLWLSRQNRGSNADAFLGLLSHIGNRSEIVGVAVLVALALIAAGSWILRRSDLATVASIALLIAAIAVWTFSSLPNTSILTIVYSDIALWPVGMLVWLVWLWTAAAMVSAAVRALRHRSRQPASQAEEYDLAGIEIGATGAAPVAILVSEGRRYGFLSSWSLATCILLVGIGGATVAASTIRDPHLGVPGGWFAVDMVPRAAAAVDHAQPSGPIALYVNASNSDIDYAVAYGVIWQLRQEGRDATATYPHWQPLGAAAAPAPKVPELTLEIRNNRTVTVTG
jgi:hypothetical protein